MALFPCSTCRRRFRGRARHAYTALARGAEALRTHLRLCADCYGDLVAVAAVRLHEMSDDEDSSQLELLPDCSWCARPSATSSFVYFTAYSGDDPPRSFFGQVCQDCSGLTIKALGLDGVVAPITLSAAR